MGADFLLWSAPLPRGLDRDGVRRLVDNVDDERIGQIYDDLFLSDDDKTTASKRDALIDLVVDVVVPVRRDTSTFHVDGVDYLVSGGLSWGEEPTDACRGIDALDAIMGAQPHQPVTARATLTTIIELLAAHRASDDAASAEETLATITDLLGADGWTGTDR